MKSNIALALCGGGVRGAGHVGAIRAIEETGHSICALSGCSFGALVAVAYSAGADWRGIPKRIPDYFNIRHIRPGWGQGGLISADIILGLLKSLDLPENLEDLPIPVTINATDLVEGKSVYFNTGPIATLVSASCCLPGLMAPIQYKGMILVDGGVLDVLPVAPLQGLGFPVWAIHTNAYPAGALPEVSTRIVLERMGQLILCKQAQERRSQVDRFIEPESLGNYRMMDWHLAEKIAEEGYAAIREELRTKSEK